MMNVESILEAWLTEHGYDGLSEPGTECGCPVKDLFLCDSCPHECEPAYHRDCRDCKVTGCDMREDNDGCFHLEKLNKSRIRPDDEPILCKYLDCAHGMGQAGAGICPGDWTDPNCTEFITNDDFLKLFEKKES